jgi:proteic killer suppression protein
VSADPGTTQALRAAAEQGCWATVVARRATRYTLPLIQSFRHKGLRRFYDAGSVRGIQAKHAKRLCLLLLALETSQVVGDMNVPGFRLHPLKGSERGRWSVWLNGI